MTNQPKLSEVFGLKRKKISPHDTHTMDDNWCYDCDDIVPDNELPCGNNKYNQCIDELDQLSPDVEELANIINNAIHKWNKIPVWEVKPVRYYISQEIISSMHKWINKNEKLINVEALAKELFEICCYPDHTKWEDIKQNEKDVWVYRAGIVFDNMHKWIKKG